MLLSSFSLLTTTISITQQPQPLLEDNDKKLPNNKVSADEENIDSFDVNPKSDRWSITDTVTDDTIIDSNLRIISSTNDTSSTSEYFAQRGLTKSDAKYEYRYKTEYDGDNTSEYFRDVLGDSADFEEDDENFIYLAGSAVISISQSNRLIDISWGTTTQLGFSGIDASKLLYNQIEIKIKGNLTLWSFRDQDNIVLGSQLSITTSFVVYTISITPTNDLTQLRLRNDNGAIATTQIDYIKLIGSYDYATHDESVGDTWDWKDSLEYFFDDLGNVSDFRDGTTENWTISGGLGDTINNLNAEFLNITDAAGTVTEIARTGLSIDASGASGFDYFTMEFNSTIAITDIAISDGTNEVCADSTGWVIDDFHLFTCDLDLDADWTGTETDLTISFIHANAATEIHINMVFLYDTELGDLEGFIPGVSNGFDRLYVNPEGYLKGGAGNGQTFEHFRSQTSLIIDSSIFDVVKFRLKGETSLKWQLFAKAVGSGSSTALNSQQTFSDPNFNIYTIDLSTDSTWLANNWQQMAIAFEDDSETFEGDEYFELDYLLLLKSSNETAQDVFTIGLYDQDNSQPFLNVTQHFWNNSLFQWRVYLMDSTSTIVSYFYSDNRTYSDVYYRAKVTYNVLQSELAVEVKTDGNSKIFKVNYPDDFTSTGVIPQLFAHEKGPDIFFSTYIPYITASETWIDYIEAPYKENEWRQTEFPSDSDYLSDSPILANVQDDITDSSKWEKSIPSLDALSANLNLNITDISNFGVFSDNWQMDFKIYNIGAITGDKELLISITIFSSTSPAVEVNKMIVSDGLGTTILEHNDIAPSGDIYDMDITFSFGLRNDRSEFDFSAILIPDEDFFAPVTGAYSNNISSFNSDPSQEFLIETEYDFDFESDTEIIFKLNNLAYLERDIFSDPVGFIGDVIGDAFGGLVGLILKPLFDFLATIIRFILSGLTAIVTPLLEILQIAMEAAISTLGTLLEAALTTLGTLLEAAIDALQPFLTLIEDAIDGLITFLEDIADEIIALATTIWTAFLDIVSDILDVIVPLIGQFISDVVDVFLPFLFGVWDALVKFVLNSIDPSEDMYNGVVNIVNSFSDAITSIIALFSFMGDPIIFAWLTILVIAMVFTFTAVKNQDPTTGRINVPGYVNSLTNVGMANVNRNQVLGFTIFVPFLLLIYIVVKILIAEGTFPDIFGNLPI